MARATRAAEQPVVGPPEDGQPLTPEWEQRRDFEWFAPNCLKVIPKGGSLTPFQLNYTQHEIHNAVKRAREQNIPARIICLKSRQVGVSTVSSGLLFHGCYAWRNTSSLILAHKDSAARGLFRMMRTFQRNLPPEMRWNPRLDNVREMEFEGSGSRLQVEAVGEVRSFTAQRVLLSEFAFYDKGAVTEANNSLAAETLVAIMQVVPGTPESLVVIESTANGVGNKFHEIWVRSIRGQAEAEQRGVPYMGFVPIFIPWFKHEEYRATPTFSREDVTPDEYALARTHKLSLRQIAWRRIMIETNCGGDEEKFKVEYPSTWQEAFLLSGRPVFAAKALKFYAGLVPPEVPEASLPPRCEILWDEAEKRPKVFEAHKGRLRVYRPPQARHTYVIGADPSEGDPGSTASPLAVLDQMTLNCDALWYGRQPPELLADTAMWLGRYYNNALIANEANNHGISFHQTMLRAEYPNIFFRQTSEQSVAGEVTMKPGWIQTKQNKHLLVNTFRKYALDKVDKHAGEPTRLIQDPNLVSEMHTLIYKQGQVSSEIIAQPGHLFDTVMAFGIALAVHRLDVEAPLEPLPDAVIESAALQAALARQRDPEAAEKIALDMTSMTCDELERLHEVRSRRSQRRSLFGLNAMR